MVDGVPALASLGEHLERYPQDWLMLDWTISPRPALMEASDGTRRNNRGGKLMLSCNSGLWNRSPPVPLLSPLVRGLPAGGMQTAATAGSPLT